jgi:hypothetical protein
MKLTTKQAYALLEKHGWADVAPQKEGSSQGFGLSCLLG